jgi:hypothetical protein
MKWSGEPDPTDSRDRSTTAGRGWNSVCSSLIAIGVAAAVASLGWATPATAFVVATFAFWLFAACLIDDLRPRIAQLVEWSLITAAAVVAMFGLWALAQGWAVVVALGMAACHPRLVSLLRRGSTTRPRSATKHGPASDGFAARPAPCGVSLDRPTRLSDDGLRKSWGASFALLQQAQGPHETGQIVHYRRACLDEIERRYPDTFAQWLEAGAPNVDEPARQLPSTFTVDSSS